MGISCFGSKDKICGFFTNPFFIYQMSLNIKTRKFLKTMVFQLAFCLSSLLLERACCTLPMKMVFCVLIILRVVFIMFMWRACFVLVTGREKCAFFHVESISYTPTVNYLGLTNCWVPPF